MTEKAYAVPLHEQLARVPRDARLVIDDPDGMGTKFIPVGRYCHEAAAELRAALAQPEPEPVAWDDAPTKIYLQICDDVDCDLSFEAHDDVSWCQDKINDCDVAYVRADTAPPKKEWQGLTLDEIYDSTHGFTRIQKDDWVATDTDIAEFAHIIEARLKAKNT